MCNPLHKNRHLLRQPPCFQYAVTWRANCGQVVNLLRTRFLSCSNWETFIMNDTLKRALMLAAMVVGVALPTFAGEGIRPVTMPEPGTIAMLVSGLGVVIGARGYMFTRKK